MSTAQRIANLTKTRIKHQRTLKSIPAHPAPFANFLTNQQIVLQDAILRIDKNIPKLREQEQPTP